MNLFFDKNSYNPFSNFELSQEPLEWMKKMSVRLLPIEEANKIDHKKLFDLLISRGKHVDHVLSLPLLPISNSVKHILAPHSIEDHDDIFINGINLRDIVEDFINSASSDKKYIFSCDPRHFVCAEIEKFSYEIAFALAQNGGGNTDFIVFDRNLSKWLTYSTDRPLVIISCAITPEGDFSIGGIPDKYWQNLFKENMPLISESCSNSYIELFNKTYLPRLSGFCELPKKKK